MTVAIYDGAKRQLYYAVVPEAMLVDLGSEVWEDLASSKNADELAQKLGGYGFDLVAAEAGGRLLGRVIATKGSINLPTFSKSTVDEVIASSSRPVGQTTEGVRAIDKKIGHAESGGYDSAFDGLPRSQAEVNRVIREILEDPDHVFFGDKVVDVYDASGRGVRFTVQDHTFMGFLERSLQTQ